MTVFADVKKVVGVPEDDHSFDKDFEIYVNAALSNLVQIGGILPHGILVSADDPVDWRDLTGHISSKHDLVQQIQAYTCLYVRLLFDPPATSFVINAMEKQLDEMVWRIREAAEGETV